MIQKCYIFTAKKVMRKFLVIMYIAKNRYV